MAGNWDDIHLEDGELQEQSEQSEQSKQKRPSKSVILFELLREWEVELFRDVDTGETLCRYSRAGHAVVNPLGSEAFLSWAVCGFYEATGSTISSALAKEAFLLLQAQAAKGRKTHVRVGEHGGKVYIDLCNEAFETVEITSEGWRVVTGAPVYFV